MLTYQLSVLAMFKNESWIIREWIEHYISEGVEHFYLIDNGSTDDYKDKIKDYMNLISLVKDPTRLPYGTQSHLYQKIFFDKIKKETKWIITCDIDEYIYSRNEFNTIKDVLNHLPNVVETIWLPWKIFGSNNNIKQPNSVVSGFTRRSNEPDKFLGHGKSIIQTKKLVNFGCCGHYVELDNDTKIYTANGDNYYLFDFTEETCSKLNLHLNHYMMLSEEYYLKIKASRGGGESGLINKYSINYFKENDVKYNKIIDNELLRKKNILYNKLSDAKISFSIRQYELFNKYLNRCTYYLEYGSGHSTYLASLKPNIKKIISIDNDYNNFTKSCNIMYNRKEYISLFTKVDNEILKDKEYSIEKKESINNYNNSIKLLNKEVLQKLDMIFINGICKIYNWRQ
jgi:hypothetical protein